MSSPESIYNYYIQFHLNLDKSHEILRIYPKDLSDDHVQKIIKYGLSCCYEYQSGEIFLLVFTNHTGVHEYVYVMVINPDDFLVISSNSPYHAVFHQLLKVLFDYGWNKNSISSIESVFVKLKGVTGYEKFSSLKISSPVFGETLRLYLPSQNSTYFNKYLVSYLSSLEIISIVDVHTSLLLERNILFMSQSRSKLTSCIMAAHSLLYPMVWVHCFYPILPEFALEVLESPVPFIAGIHSCLYAKARKYLTPGTRLVDLDQGRIFLIQLPQSSKKSNPHLNKRLNGSNGLKKSKSDDSLAFDTRAKSRSSNFDGYHEPENTLNGGIPDVVVTYFEQGLKSVEKLQSRLNKGSPSLEDKENLNEKFDNLSQTSQQFIDPFFDFNVNILGFYSECLEPSTLGVIMEPNIKKMIAIQGCRSIDDFLKEVYNSQMCRVFFDERVQRTDPSPDKFDELSAALNSIIRKKFSTPLQKLRPEELSVHSYGDNEWRMAKSSNIFSSTIAFKLFNYRSASSRLIDKIKKRSRTTVKVFGSQDDSPPTTTCTPILFSDSAKTSTWGSFSEKKQRFSLPKSADFDSRKNRFVSTSSIDTLNNPSISSIDEPVRFRHPSSTGRLQAVKVTSVNSFTIKKPRSFLRSRPISVPDGGEYNESNNEKNIPKSTSSYQNSPVNLKRQNGSSVRSRNYSSLGKDLNDRNPTYLKPNGYEPTRRPRLIAPRTQSQNNHDFDVFSGLNSSNEFLNDGPKMPPLNSEPPRRPRLAPRRSHLNENNPILNSHYEEKEESSSFNDGRPLRANFTSSTPNSFDQ